MACAHDPVVSQLVGFSTTFTQILTAAETTMKNDIPYAGALIEATQLVKMSIKAARAYEKTNENTNENKNEKTCERPGFFQEEMMRNKPLAAFYNVLMDLSQTVTSSNVLLHAKDPKAELAEVGEDERDPIRIHPRVYVGMQLRQHVFRVVNARRAHLVKNSVDNSVYISVENSVEMHIDRTWKDPPSTRFISPLAHAGRHFMNALIKDVMMRGGDVTSVLMAIVKRIWVDT